MKRWLLGWFLRDFLGFSRVCFKGFLGIFLDFFLDVFFCHGFSRCLKGFSSVF